MKIAVNTNPFDSFVIVAEAGAKVFVPVAARGREVLKAQQTFVEAGPGVVVRDVQSAQPTASRRDTSKLTPPKASNPTQSPTPPVEGSGSRNIEGGQNG